MWCSGDWQGARACLQLVTVKMSIIAVPQVPVVTNDAILAVRRMVLFLANHVGTDWSDYPNAILHCLWSRISTTAQMSNVLTKDTP